MVRAVCSVPRTRSWWPTSPARSTCTLVSRSACRAGPLELRLIEQLPDAARRPPGGRRRRGRPKRGLARAPRSHVRPPRTRASRLSLGEFAALGGDAVIAVDGRRARSELRPRLGRQPRRRGRHGSTGQFRPASPSSRAVATASVIPSSAGSVAFVTQQLTEGFRGVHAKPCGAGDIQNIREEQIDGVSVWVYELPGDSWHQPHGRDHQPGGRDGDKGGKPGPRRAPERLLPHLRQLSAKAVNWLRAEYKDTLTLIVTPAGSSASVATCRCGPPSRTNVVRGRGEMVDHHRRPRPVLQHRPAGPAVQPGRSSDVQEGARRGHRPLLPRRGSEEDGALRGLPDAARLPAWRPRRASPSACTTWRSRRSKRRSSTERAQAQVKETETQYNEGLITPREKYNKVVDIWTKVTAEISDSLIKGISVEEVVGRQRQHRDAALLQLHLHDGRLGCSRELPRRFVSSPVCVA